MHKSQSIDFTLICLTRDTLNTISSVTTSFKTFLSQGKLLAPRKTTVLDKTNIFRQKCRENFSSQRQLRGGEGGFLARTQETRLLLSDRFEILLPIMVRMIHVNMENLKSLAVLL